MTEDLILMNLGYAAMFVAMYVASQIKLRSLLIFYQAVTIWRAVVYIDNLNMFIWHALFLLLNAYRLYEMYRESREVNVPPVLKDLKDMVFNTMSPREFFRLWDFGYDVAYPPDAVLLQEGKKNDRLIMILEGKVDVQIQGGVTIAQNGRGDFVGEMSLLTRKPVSATVVAQEEVVCREWTRTSLDVLQKKHPHIYQKLQGEMGRDIVDKLVATNERLANNIAYASKDLADRDDSGANLISRTMRALQPNKAHEKSET